MHPTTAFAAPFGFVGWTIPLPLKQGYLPSGLYTFPDLTRGLARDYHITTVTQASPNLTGVSRRLLPRKPDTTDHVGAKMIQMTKPLVCRICGKLLAGRQTRFCSTSCKNKHHQSYEAQKRRGIDRKLMLIEAEIDKCILVCLNCHAELRNPHLDLDLLC